MHCYSHTFNVNLVSCFSVIKRQRCTSFSKPGLPEMKCDPALKVSPGLVQYNISTKELFFKLALLLY